MSDVALQGRLFGGLAPCDILAGTRIGFERKKQGLTRLTQRDFRRGDEIYTLTSCTSHTTFYTLHVTLMGTVMGIASMLLLVKSTNNKNLLFLKIGDDATFGDFLERRVLARRHDAVHEPAAAAATLSDFTVSRFRGTTKSLNHVRALVSRPRRCERRAVNSLAVESIRWPIAEIEELIEVFIFSCSGNGHVTRNHCQVFEFRSSLAHILPTLATKFILSLHAIDEHGRRYLRLVPFRLTSC